MPADNCVAPTVTTTVPFVAPVGAGTTISVGLQLQGIAVTPLNLTVPLDPRLLPVMVTAAPMPPMLGDIVETLGVPGTVKVCVPRLDCQPTMTTTFPVRAPEGTVILIEPASHWLAVPARTPLNATVLDPWELP